MDSYVEQFQAAGGSLVMLAKGNRSAKVATSCAAYGGFYLGSIGGPAARLAQDCIRKVDVLEYPELGMEAVWKIEVEDFPAFVVVDDKGNDFFAEVSQPTAARCRSGADPPPGAAARGRLGQRSRRGPGVGAGRRRAEHDPGAGDERARGRGQHRVQAQRAHLGQVLGHPADPQHQVLQRLRRTGSVPR